MLEYLKEFHDEEIINLLNDSNDFVHVGINLNLSHLQKKRPNLFDEFVVNVWEESIKWNRSLLEAQKQLIEGNAFLEPGYQIKENCHVRFVNLPHYGRNPKGLFPNNDHIGLFVQVKGSVVRMTQSKLLEFKREYACSRCKESFTLEAEYSKMYIFEIPRHCLNTSGTCKGVLQQKNANPKSEHCMDYQEIRIQELFTDKNVPASLIVTLDNDLVDYCQPGDSVTICGTIERRWKPFAIGKRSEVMISLRAISICKDGEKVNFGKDLSEQLLCVRAQWQDTIDEIGVLNARDNIISSICPEIHGMYLVKLAIALSLSSCVEYNSNSTGITRGHSHLLLVGDPGLAKSRLLKSASKIALRSVHTTGMGCSAAGLTAAALKEEGEWQLEAGALVLADGGICCIDEFNLMRETDKASIHEAMEQQTISMAKAGLVCKLSTRCVVIAATNPKNLYNMSNSEGTSAVNIGIGSPLLSRFDVILILRDERDPNWDSLISDHVLKNTNMKNLSQNIWEIERLQSHFLAVHSLNPKITPEANEILGAYYRYCRSDSMRDPSRSTVRLLDSLNRLAQAHARLTFRNQVSAIDAIAIVRLMESSWGFGRLIRSVHILREELPLGPNEDQVCEILDMLSLHKLKENTVDELRKINIPFRSEEINKIGASGKRKNSLGENELNETFESVENPIRNDVININNLEKVFGFHGNVKKIRKSNEIKEIGKNYNQPITSELEIVHNEIFNENRSNVEKPSEQNVEIIINSNSTHINDSEEILCSQFHNIDSTNFNMDSDDDIIASLDTAEIQMSNINKDECQNPQPESRTMNWNIEEQIINKSDNFVVQPNDLLISNTEHSSKANKLYTPKLPFLKEPEKEKLNILQQTEEVNKENLKSYPKKNKFLDDLDFDDIDLELNSFACKNDEPKVKKGKDLQFKTLLKLDKYKYISKTDRIDESTNCGNNGIPPNSSKTVDKCDVNLPNISPVSRLQKSPSKKSDTEDSAYKTMLWRNSGVSQNKSGSHILAAQDDDLDCLEFDL